MGKLGIVKRFVTGTAHSATTCRLAPIADFMVRRRRTEKKRSLQESVFYRVFQQVLVPLTRAWISGEKMSKSDFDTTF